MDERDYTAEAAEQGWTPKEEWKGAEDKWTDAKTFVERGEKIAGILKSRLDRQETQIANLQESNRKFGEFHKETLETARKKSTKQISELEGQLAQAITDGDGQAYTQTRREIDDLKTEIPTDDAGQYAQAWNQLATQWVTENPWYNTNPKLATYADGLQERIQSEGYNGQAYFSELTERVKEAFPDSFTNPNKTKSNGVEEGGQLSTPNSKEHTYENLDAEGKAACDDFVKQGFMKREDYLAQYQWDE